jgi:hypothetical protein
MRRGLKTDSEAEIGTLPAAKDQIRGKDHNRRQEEVTEQAGAHQLAGGIRDPHQKENRAY